MSATLPTILTLVNFVTMLMHLLGSYLLVQEYIAGLDDSQQLYLINLSVSEGIINLLQFLINTGSQIMSIPKSRSKQFQYYIKTVRGYGFVTVYFLTMIYLTLDRMFDILLNIRYALYWNEKYTKYLLQMTWVISITTTIIISVVDHHYPINAHEILDVYIYPTFDVLFIIIACFTYAFIFQKYKQTRVHPVNRDVGPPMSTFEVFRRSKFYIPLLLIITFTIFMAIPEMIHLFYIRQRHEPVVLKTVLCILWALSYLCDAIIYIWMKPSVKALLKYKLGIRCRTDSMNTPSESDERTSVLRFSEVFEDSVV